MTLLFTNDAASTLAGGITDTATSALLQAGTGYKFPNPANGDYFKLTLISQLSSQDKEIVHVTARSGDIITIVRGREGTAARTWLAGDSVELMITAECLSVMTQNINLINTAGSYAGDSGTNNAIIVTFSPVPLDITAYSGALLRIRRGTQINTGAVTLTVNTQGGAITRNLVNASGAPLIAGELSGPTLFTCAYDPVSDVFRLQSFSYPPVGIKSILAADIIYYVNAATGNDTNDGSVSSPWLTLQHAYDYVTTRYDFSGGFTTTIKCSGSFTSGVLAGNSIVGGSFYNVIFEFQSASQLNVVNTSCFSVFSNNAGLTITTAAGAVPLMTASGSAFGQGTVLQVNSGNIALAGHVNFGVCGNLHIFAGYNGRVIINSSYDISGGAIDHLDTIGDGSILYFVGNSGPLTVTLTGTPAFSGQFASCLLKSLIYAPSGTVSFSGSATGKRFTVTDVSLINVNGGGNNFFPGSIAGTASNAFNYG